MRLGRHDPQDPLAARRPLVEALLKEEARSRPEDHGPVMLRVAHHTQGEHGEKLWRLAKDPAYDYRTVLASEIVFDQGDHGDWMRARSEAHALWTALDRWGLRYHAALSAGNGIHTHVYMRPLDPESDLVRGTAATFIRWAVQLALAEDDLADVDDTEDPRLLTPAWQSRLIREFGARKSPDSKWRKTLWSDSKFRPLPETREEAYAQAGLVLPRELSMNDFVPGWMHHEIASALGPCPKSADCLFDPYGTCDHCPSGA